MTATHGDAASQAGRCGTCEHWDRENSCVSGTPPGGYGCCDRISGHHQDQGDGAFIAFGYDLITTADFGCVLHEPREENHEPA